MHEFMMNDIMYFRSLLPHSRAYGDSLVKGGRGVDLPEILHILLALPEFSPLFCPNLGGQLPPPPCLVRPCPHSMYSFQVTDKELEMMKNVAALESSNHRSHKSHVVINRLVPFKCYVFPPM